MITTELLQTIHDKTSAFCVAKFGFEPGSIVIRCAGVIECIKYDYEGYEDKNEYLLASELYADLNVITAERNEKLRLDEIKKQEIQKEIAEKKDKADKELYLKLKEKFGD